MYHLQTVTVIEDTRVSLFTCSCIFFFIFPDLLDLIGWSALSPGMLRFYRNICYNAQCFHMIEDYSQLSI